MKADWNVLGALAAEHLGNTFGSMVGALAIGLLVSIALILVFWKLGVFRRPVNTWYNVGAKLYIPYILVVCLTIAAQCGFYRAVYMGMLAVNDAVAATLYERAIGPALGSPAARQAFVSQVQETVHSGQNLGQAITGTIKGTLHKRLTAESSMTDRLAAAVADRLIDHYENDIASAVLYGIYLKGGGYLEMHGSNEPMEYHEFKEGADYLVGLDLAEVEKAVKGNLGLLTHGLLKHFYKGAVNSALFLGALLVLLPMVEWGIYHWVMQRRRKAMEESSVVPAPPSDRTVA